MKYFYFILAFLLTCNVLQAQIVTIPDANFKNTLVNLNCIDTNGSGTPDSDADINNDGEIQVAEAEAVSSLIIINNFNNEIQNLSGIEAFVNLENLELDYHQLFNTVDLTNSTLLKRLVLTECRTTVLDLTNCLLLEELNLDGNMLSTIDLSNNLALETLDLSDNYVTNVDISNNVNLRSYKCNYSDLITLNVDNNINLELLECINNEITNLNLLNNLGLNSLSIDGNEINSLDLSNNILLEYLSISFNPITELNLVNNVNIKDFLCSYSQITELDLSTNTQLENLNISNTPITELDLSNNTAIVGLVCRGTEITTLDLSDLINLEVFYLRSNQNLAYINFKNGNNPAMNNSLFSVVGNMAFMPNIEAICVDDINTIFGQNIINITPPSVTVTDYCTFVPGGEFNTIQGESRVDLNSNGCDTLDSVYPNLNIVVSSGGNSTSYFGDDFGNHNIALPDGTYNIFTVLENPNYFTVSPTTSIIDLPSDGVNYNLDFCLTANNIAYDDLEVVIVPIEEARPGFDVDYKIIYKNKGNTTLNGSLSFNFEDNVMNLASSNPIVNSQNNGNLIWNFDNLLPLQTEEIFLTMNLNAPTDVDFPLNENDILNYSIEINPLVSDETPDDNVFTLDQNVVNSFDPNDKRCLQGEFINQDMVGKYIHYIVRFENTGTANAINVVIKDEIDLSKFDITTLIPLSGSHDFMTRIRNTNEVEFIFENIDLPFDDANNDGYVVFKIQTVDTLTEGDTFSNDAEIYFDFNFPIITNDFETIVEANLSVNEFEQGFAQVFPNPANDELHISSETVIDTADIYDVNGRLLQSINFVGNQLERTIDIAHLAKGVYVVQLTSEYGELTKKVIKD